MLRISVLIFEIFYRWVQNINKKKQLKETICMKVFENKLK